MDINERNEHIEYLKTACPNVDWENEWVLEDVAIFSGYEESQMLFLIQHAGGGPFYTISEGYSVMIGEYSLDFEKKEVFNRPEWEETKVEMEAASAK